MRHCPTPARLPKNLSYPKLRPQMTHTVLITGAAKRLGAELTRRFARAGWQVWCHYQRSEPEAKALQAELEAELRTSASNAGNTTAQRIHTVYADLASEADIVAMVETIRAHSGVLRCVVNNASSFDPDSGLSMDSASLMGQLQINLMAPLLLGRELARQAVEGVDHSVIHVLDQKVFNLNPDYFSYTVSKLALERSVALQAQSFAPRVRVCGVAPGLMYPSGPQSLSNFERASTVNLQRQAIDPTDVANTCVFLANNASINGSTLCVDKGQHLVPLARDVMFAIDPANQGAA